MLTFLKRRKKHTAEPVETHPETEKAASQPLASVTFTQVKGDREPHQLTLFALSTCGFCRKAMEMLDEFSVTYQYIYIDKASTADKRIIKDFVKEQFSATLSYPFLVIDNSRYINGFLRVEWIRILEDA